MRYFQATQEQTYTWISWFTSSKLVGWCILATHHDVRSLTGGLMTPGEGAL